MSKSSKLIQFDVYRYQIVPLSRQGQASLFEEDYLSEEDLLKKKNIYFQEAVEQHRTLLEGRKIEYLYKILNTTHDNILIRLATRKNLNIDTKEFTERVIETFPNIFILINNNPSVQEIIIQKNYKAFTYTNDVIKILERNINKYLRQHNLQIYIQPIFDQKDFWNLAQQYEGRITKLSFDLVRPNMPNISGVLSEDLKELQKTSNSHRTKLELNAGTGNVLTNITEQNSQVKNMVDYASNGGGDIYLKAKGVKSKIKTNKSVTEFSVNELEIRTDNVDDIIKIIKHFRG